MHLRQQIGLVLIRTKFNLLWLLSKKKAANSAFKLFCTPQQRSLKDLPPIFQQAEKMELCFQNHTIQGYRWNYPSDKKILILHGFASSAINFDQYVAPLIKMGFEVLAFDAPAHGRSSGKQITVVLYKEFICHLRKEFGPITSFLAHSFGGLCLCIALEEINADENGKLVLIAPATETNTAIKHFIQILKLNAGFKKEFDRVIIALSGHDSSWFSIRRIASEIKANVLWVQDKEDDMTPLSDVEPIIAQRYPNFEFFITEGLGHRRIYRDEKVISKILNFLCDEKTVANIH